ncbi:hypothetical protein G6F65_018653 [Rhizopus arrhizus]|nr:hypothetical protein G6F65_018653 [Rhizopus arrhizus]
MRPVVARAVLGRVIGSRVRTGAVRHPFDQGRAQVAAGTFGGPARGGIDCQEIVAVHPQRRDAAAHAAAREGRAFAAGDCLEGENGPLVVDYVQDDRRAVHMRERQRGVEVGLGGRAVADPGRHHPGDAGRPRRAGPGPDRYRQDRCVRTAGTVQHRPAADQAPGPDPGADPRAGHPGGRGVPVVFVEDPGLPRAAGVRRPAVRPAAVGAAPRRAHRGRYTRPRDRSPGPQHPGPVRAEDPGAGRSRRNAAHGLHR